MNILGFGTGISTLLSGDATGIAGSLLNTAPYAQESLQINNTMTAGAASFDVAGSLTNLWVSGYVMHEADTFLKKDILVVKDSADTAWFKLTANTDGKYSLQYYDGASWVETSKSTFTDANAVHRIDVEYSATAVRLYVDKVLEVESVATIPTATNPLTKIELYNPQTLATAHSYWSSVFAADSSTVKTVMNQHSLTGDGVHHSGFTGSYADVDDFATLGENSTINSEVGGSTQTFTKDAIPTELATGYNMVALGMYLRAVENSQVSSQLQTVVTDGTDTNLGSLYAVPTGNFETLKEIEHTAQDNDFWTAAKFDASEIGVKCVI